MDQLQSTGFNPVVGFLTVSTQKCRSMRYGAQASFNPVVGFLTVSTGDASHEVRHRGEFQSRRGFSDRLDGLRPTENL